MAVAAFLYFQGFKESDPQAPAVQPFDPEGGDRAIVLEGELGQSRRRHGLNAEKRHRNTVVHLLIDGHAQVLPLRQ